MKILIIGGSGFLGRWVARNFKAKGHEVSVFDLKESTEEVNFIKGSVIDKEAISKAVSETDIVINLAGVLGTSESVDNPKVSVDINIGGALNVFEACKEHGKRCMQIGSGNYWMNNPYSITKDAILRFAQMYNKEFGTEIVIVRGLNVYGPEQKHRPIRKMCPNAVIPALLNKPITIYGDGEQIMDWIYVEDIAEIISQSVLQDHGMYGYVFEAGTGGEETINEFVKIILDITGSKSELKYVPMRAGEEENSVVKGDPETLKPLGITKLTSLEEGLKKTINWYKENLNKYKWDE